MKNLILLIAIAAIAFVSLDSETASASDDKFKRARSPIPNRYIVVLEDNKDQSLPDDVTTAAMELNASFPGTIGDIYEAAIRGYVVEMSEAEAQMLSRDPRVKFVEEDGIVETQSVQPNATWGIARIDTRLRPALPDTNFEYFATGRGVNVYVVDTGVNTLHPDFEGRAFDAANFSGDNTPVADCNGHGTHVAGTIGSATFGVAKGVSIYSVRVFPCWGGTATSNVVSAVDWLTRHAVAPAVANLSLSGGVSATLDQAVQNSINRGITYTIAAGNSGGNACDASPARVPGAITVGMTDERDFKADVSNYGSCVDIFAPGSAIVSTGNFPAYPMEHTMSGTSAAAPHVAGVAAAYLERNPTASSQQVADAIISNSTVDILSEIGTGSPNRFLFSNFIPDGGGQTCAGTVYAGQIINSGGTEYQSGLAGFSGRSGNYSGRLSFDAGAQFSLSLEAKKGNRWSTLAATGGTSPSGAVSVKGKNGTYRWKIQSATGGAYSLCSVVP